MARGSVTPRRVAAAGAALPADNVGAFDAEFEAISHAPVVNLSALDDFLSGWWRIATRAAADPADWRRMHTGQRALATAVPEPWFLSDRPERGWPRRMGKAALTSLEAGKPERRRCQLRAARHRCCRFSQVTRHRIRNRKLRGHVEVGADHVGIQVIGIKPGQTAMPYWRTLAEALLPRGASA